MAHMSTEENIHFEILRDISDNDDLELKTLIKELDETAVFDKNAVLGDIKNGVTSIFVYREDSRIKASATVARFSTPTGTHYNIEDVVVHSSLRGKGIGKKMVQHMLEELRKSNAKSVNLTSRPSRIAANALYRSLGFEQRETNVYQYKFEKRD